MLVTETVLPLEPPAPAGITVISISNKNIKQLAPQTPLFSRVSHGSAVQLVIRRPDQPDRSLRYQFDPVLDPDHMLAGLVVESLPLLTDF